MGWTRIKPQTRTTGHYSHTHLSHLPSVCKFVLCQSLIISVHIRRVRFSVKLGFLFVLHNMWKRGV